jgi:hypothetical protein
MEAILRWIGAIMTSDLLKAASHGAYFLVPLLFASASYAIPPPPVPDAPPGTATYTREQLETIPSQDLARQLFGGFARVFVEKRMDENIGFYTAPKMAFAGVCSVQHLVVHMASDPRSGRVYANGLAIEELYHLVNLPKAFSPTRIESFDDTRPLCDALPSGTIYFPAPSALVVAYQHHLVDDAVTEAKTSAKLNFKLDCIRSAHWGCEAHKVLAGIDPSAIRSIVPRDCAGLSRNECYEINMGDWYLEVESRLSTYGYTLVEPDRILVGVSVSKLPHDLAVGCEDCDKAR